MLRIQQRKIDMGDAFNASIIALPAAVEIQPNSERAGFNIMSETIPEVFSEEYGVLGVREQ